MGDWTLLIVHHFPNVWWNFYCFKTTIKCNFFRLYIHWWSRWKNNLNRRFRREDFQKIAQLIANIFPNETVDTYFVPAQNGKIAKGKLWDSYNHLRATLANVGFIERRSRKPKSDSVEENLGFEWLTAFQNFENVSMRKLI